MTQGNFVAYNNLGVDLEARGEKEEAARWYREAIHWKPDYVDAHCNLGDIYAALKRPREAIAEFQTALKLNPGMPRAHFLLANQLLAEGDVTGAEAHYQTALAANPNYAEAHYQMAVLLLGRDEVEKACNHYREALALKPDWVAPLNNLTWLLATCPDARFRNGEQAVALAAHGVSLTQTNDAGLLDTLGVALAEAGRFGEAEMAARRGADRARASGSAELGREIEARIQGYERRQPFREPKAATAK